MVHRFHCRCGTVQGEVLQPRQGVRAACYCRDCQAYAHVLGEPGRVLDAAGGTEVVATQAPYVRFTAGTSSLACLSLSPRGLLRWYARCCATPIANTPRDWRLPYVGLVHTGLGPVESLEGGFGPVQLRVNTQSARAAPPGGRGLRGWARFGGLVVRLLAARLRGTYRASPFFDREGRPAVPVEVVPREKVEQARREVAAAIGP